MTTTAHAIPRPGGGGALLWLWRYLRPEGPGLTAILLCLVLEVALRLAGPVLAGRFIDRVVQQGSAASTASLAQLAVLFIVACLAAQAARLAVTYLSTLVEWRATNRLRDDLMTHSLGLGLAFHQTRTPGEMIERIDGDVVSLASAFTQFLFQILGSGLLLGGVLMVLVSRSPWIGAVLALVVLLSLSILTRSRDLGVSEFAEEREGRSRLAGFLEERLKGLEDIRANGGGAASLAKLDALNAFIAARGIAGVRRAALYSIIITNAVFFTGYVAALAVAILLVQRDLLTVGSVVVLIQYTALLRTPLENIGQQGHDLKRAMASLRRVRDLLATPAPGVRASTARLPPGALSVRFDAVTFAYEGKRPVLEGLSLDLPAGATLGLLGRTGSGKSTVMRLLSGLYDAGDGRITLGGLDIRGIARDQLSARVGVVPQDVQIFQANVRDNLTLFDPTIPDEALHEALADVGLGAWFGRQAQGLDTELNPGGALSAGEAQLLAFARVLLRDCGLVLLDEASSRLDAQTQRGLDHAMQRLIADRTRTGIIVAHRLETVARLDWIAILDQGRVVEAGLRRDLAGNPGSRFAGLLRSGPGPLQP